MLFKKKLFKKKQLLLKYFFKKNELKSLIIKSLFRNHYNGYTFRLSFSISSEFPHPTSFFKTRQKLICIQTLDKKVPSKRFLFSRFALNKQLNSLHFCNTLK